MPFIQAAGIGNKKRERPEARAGPRSNINTRAFFSFTNRQAATQPAEPPPTMI
jgi:hypothetical protein